MIKIAIVEDRQEDRKKLKEVLERYADASGEVLQIMEFPDAPEFLHQCRGQYQIVFMDVGMPYMNGLDAARKFRRLDTEAVLIFITGMAQYAVRGYEVDALDYIVKPVQYDSFVLKMKRAVQQVKCRADLPYVIPLRSGFRKISRREIRYVEVTGHRIIYHTDQEDIPAYGTMKEVLRKLPDPAFALCNSCYYVNMHYVTGVENFTVYLGDVKLQISHPRKKEFMKALNAYLGGSSI